MDMPQTLKGFRDFAGEEARTRQWLKDKISTVFKSYGFELLETPALEYEELLLGKYGEEANKLMYSFSDHGERRVALRYDQTVPTARFVASHKHELAFPYMRYQMQNVYRADNTQKGRYREFLQCDCDIFGTTSPIADATVLATTYAIYAALGFQDVVLKVNARHDLYAHLHEMHIAADKQQSVIQALDKLDKKSTDEVTQEMISHGIEADTAKKLLSFLQSVPMSETLETICSLTHTMGVPKHALVHTPTLARGLDYYTGLIFEVASPSYPHGSLAGGGRYDRLIEQITGVPMSAVGMAIGFDRTLDALTDLKLLPTTAGDVHALVTIFSPEYVEHAAKTAAELRERGVAVELYPADDRKLDAQLKYALARGIGYLVIVGPDEAESDSVSIKNLTNREQKSYSISDAADILKLKK